MVELEAKIKVDSHDDVRASLRRAGATFVGRYVEQNTIFDRADGSLRRSGCGLRVRSVETVEGERMDATCTFKGPVQASEYKRREEVETRVADAEGLVRVLVAVGFESAVTFEKRRESWRLDGCRVELDDVPLLGTFVEVEVDADADAEIGTGAVTAVGAEAGSEVEGGVENENENEKAGELLIRRVLEAIGLGGSNHVADGYVSMLVRRCAEAGRSAVGVRFE
jgi:adenylate cyclase, class 2